MLQKLYSWTPFFPQPGQKAESSSRDARDREVSWLLTGASLDCKKIVSEKTFQGCRESRDREVSWLLTSSSLEARTGLTQRTPGEED